MWGGITPWTLRTLKGHVRFRTMQVCFPWVMTRPFVTVFTDGSQHSDLRDQSNTVSTSEFAPGLPDADPFQNATLSHEPIPFPSLPPSSVLPSDPSHPSSILRRSSPTSDEYSWEWGGFPQRSQIHIEHPTLSDTAPLNVHDSEVDEQLLVSQPGEFQRSKSLPPEFELDMPEGVSLTSLQSDEQLNGQEPMSDVETGFDNDSSMSGRERRSWVRWWRRDSRHPRSVDVRLERPPLKSSVSTPLPSVSCILSFLACDSHCPTTKRNRGKLQPSKCQFQTSVRAKYLSPHRLGLHQSYEQVGTHPFPEEDES